MDAQCVGAIGKGLVILLGIGTNDTMATAEGMASKIVRLRIFEDGDGKMNLDVSQAGAEMLCVSQFTLYGDVRRGRRPSFDEASPSAIAQPLYEGFCLAIESGGVRCQRGVFGADMQVELVNDGPVTLVIDSDDIDRPRRT